MSVIIKQGETETIETIVLDSDGVEVSISSGATILYSLFVKEKNQKTYSNTIVGYDTLTLTGSTITVVVTRDVSKTLSIGDLYAVILITDDDITTEYRYSIGEVNKGYLKDSRISCV